MWIARDKDGLLFLYETKPEKQQHWWQFGGDLGQLNNELFPEVKWEDEEPTEIEIVIKKK